MLSDGTRARIDPIDVVGPSDRLPEAATAGAVRRTIPAKPASITLGRLALTGTAGRERMLATTVALGRQLAS